MDETEGSTPNTQGLITNGDNDVDLSGRTNKNPKRLADQITPTAVEDDAAYQEQFTKVIKKILNQQAVQAQIDQGVHEIGNEYLNDTTVNLTNKLVGEKKQLDSSLKNAEAESKRAQEETNRLTTQLATTEREFQNIQQQINGYKQQIAQLTQSTQGTQQQYIKQIATLNKRIEDLTVQSNTLQNNYNLLEQAYGSIYSAQNLIIATLKTWTPSESVRIITVRNNVSSEIANVSIETIRTFNFQESVTRSWQTYTSQFEEIPQLLYGDNRPDDALSRFLNASLHQDTIKNLSNEFEYARDIVTYYQAQNATINMSSYNPNYDQLVWDIMYLTNQTCDSFLTIIGLISQYSNATQLVIKQQATLVLPSKITESSIIKGTNEENIRPELAYKFITQIRSLNAKEISVVNELKSPGLIRPKQLRTPISTTPILGSRRIEQQIPVSSLNALQPSQYNPQQSGQVVTFGTIQRPTTQGSTSGGLTTIPSNFNNLQAMQPSGALLPQQANMPPNFNNPQAGQVVSFTYNPSAIQRVNTPSDVDKSLAIQSFSPFSSSPTDMDADE